MGSSTCRGSGLELELVMPDMVAGSQTPVLQRSSNSLHRCFTVTEIMMYTCTVGLTIQCMSEHCKTLSPCLADSAKGKGRLY